MAWQLECPPRKECVSEKVIVGRFTSYKDSLDEKTSCPICNELLALVNDGTDSDLFLDFGNVKYLTAQMLGTLVIVNKKLRNKERHLTVGNLAPLVHEVLTVMKLDKVLDLRLAAPVREGTAR
jgi:anti-anti-sigma regulatory factor